MAEHSMVNIVGVNQENAERALKASVEKQLRVTSASVDYYNQQVDIVGKQIRNGPILKNPRCSSANWY